MTQPPPPYATRQLREADRDRYFATLVVPARARPALAALYAFSAEIAAVRERAREPAAGEIRLQWWIDALSGEAHGEIRQNPLAAALLDAIATFGIPVPPLLRLIEARRFDLYHDPMPDLATFEGYAGDTVSALYQLAAMVLNGGSPIETGDAAGHLGVAEALVGHLRAFGYNASRGRIFLPLNVLAANGVTAGEVLAGQMSEGLAEALPQLAEMAGEHLDTATRAIAALPRPLRPAFAPVVLVRARLARLALETPFQTATDMADWQRLGRMAWWTLTA